MRLACGILVDLRLMATAVAMLSLVALPIEGQCASSADLDAYIIEKMQQYDVPGVAIAVVKNDKVALTKGYGTRTVGKDERVDENTLFAIGSQTKYFTVTALAILVADGKIAWNDKITEHLSGFRVMGDLVTNHATVVDLLAHRTGIERGDGAWWSRPSLSRGEILTLMKYLGPEKQFRSSYIYNNLMFVAAGEIVPVVTGVSWDKFVRTRIFQPLGMENSNTSVEEFGQNSNVATPHEISGDEIVPVPYHNIDNVGPAGSINSSALDMAQWLRMHLNDGKFGDRVIVPERVLKETRRIYNPTNDLSSKESIEVVGMSQYFTGYGVGIRVSDYGGYRTYSHGGGIDGMNAFSAFIPEIDLGVTVLTNKGSLTSKGGRFATPLAAWILDRYTGASETDWIDKFARAARNDEELTYDSQRSAVEGSQATGVKAAVLLGKYAGAYENDFMGTFTIFDHDESLTYTAGETLSGVLTQLGLDTFHVSVTEPLAVARWGRAEGTARFIRSKDGDINAFILCGRQYERKDGEQR